MKLTPWFPSKVKPVRIGIYERRIPGVGIRYAWWNGAWWGGFATNLIHAVNNQTFGTGHRYAQWRGLVCRP